MQMQIRKIKVTWHRFRVHVHLQDLTTAASCLATNECPFSKLLLFGQNTTIKEDQKNLWLSPCSELINKLITICIINKIPPTPYAIVRLGAQYAN